MKGVGPRDHGPTNIVQVTMVFNRDGELKGASGYERDHEGTTYGQWRTATADDASRLELLKAISEYVFERATAIAESI